MGNTTLAETIEELTATLLPKWCCQEFQIRRKTQSQVVVRSSQGARDSQGQAAQSGLQWAQLCEVAPESQTGPRKEGNFRDSGWKYVVPTFYLEWL